MKQTVLETAQPEGLHTAHLYRRRELNALKGLAVGEKPVIEEKTGFALTREEIESGETNEEKAMRLLELPAEQIELYKQCSYWDRPTMIKVKMPEIVEVPIDQLKFRTFPPNDVGNGDRFKMLFGNHLRHCTPWKKWLVWDGCRWATDTTNLALFYASQIGSILGSLGSPQGYSAIDPKWVNFTSSTRGMESMLKVAATHLAVTPEQLDTDPYLLNSLNGTIDLRTGALLQHERKHLITKLAPVNYEPDAECTEWTRFLNEIFEGNLPLIRYVQELLGYGLLGITSEHIFPIFWGDGRNGKGTLLETIRAVMGDYAQETPMDTFVDRRGSATNDLAALKGARLVTASESEENQRLATSLIKRITGEDPITARFLFGEFFTYKPTFKVILQTNNKPQVPAEDKALWRRLRLVPFTWTVGDGEEDLALREKLTSPEALSGILRWMVEGCLRWQEHGFSTPDKVSAATRDYRQEVDHISAWLESRCLLNANDPGLRETPSTLLTDYNSWAQTSGVPMLNHVSFASRMKSHDYLTIKSNGRNYYTGLRLIDRDSTFPIGLSRVAS